MKTEEIKKAYQELRIKNIVKYLCTFTFIILRNVKLKNNQHSHRVCQGGGRDFAP